MCTVTNIPTRKRVGYKKVVKTSDGRYLSGFTGLEYVEGMTIPQLGINDYRNGCDGWILDDPEDRHYTTDMIGKTGLLLNFGHAKNVYAGGKGLSDKKVIVKIKLKGHCVKGFYGNRPIIIGSQIEWIKEVKEVKDNRN